MRPDDRYGQQLRQGGDASSCLQVPLAICNRKNSDDADLGWLSIGDADSSEIVALFLMKDKNNYDLLITRLCYQRIGEVVPSQICGA